MVRRATLAALAATTLAAAGCGGESTCKQACNKTAQCLGIKLDAGTGHDAVTKSGSSTSSGKTTSWTCPLPTECNSARDKCRARCVVDAPCEAILGKDAVAAAALAKCQAECAKLKDDGGVSTPGYDGLVPAGDAKPPVTKRDGSSCTRSCSGKQCGDDGCGGSCGICEWPQVCGASYQCACKPSCSSKQCGDDGCGGSCGSCGTGTSCSSSGQCVSTCTPSCNGKSCGSDGCGGSCGSCGSGYTCDSYGKCVVTCTPSCSGKQCGSDGCGGTCGNCSSGYSCDSYGKCVAPTSGCGSITYQGCCSGTTLKYCSSGQIVSSSCASSPSCGWDSASKLYDCGTSGGSDPSGVYPKTCP
jgi:hypothetical protein